MVQSSCLPLFYEMGFIAAAGKLIALFLLIDLIVKGVRRNEGTDCAVRLSCVISCLMNIRIWRGAMK